MSISLEEMLKEPNAYIRYCKLVEESYDPEFITSYMSIPDYQMFLDTFIELLRDTKGRSFNELDKYRKCIPNLLKYIEQLEKNYVVYKWMADHSYLTDDNHKKWTKEKDEFLIEKVCEGLPDTLIASSLKRTASSVRQRITYLVGVKRLSQKVAGKFIGEINGEQAEANLVGTVYKR